MATSSHFVLGPGVFLSEVDEHLVAEKPGMRVRVRDERSISVLKHASANAGAPSATASGQGQAVNPELAETIEALLSCGLLASAVTPDSERALRTNDYLVSLQGGHEAEQLAGVGRKLGRAGVMVVGEPWMGAQVRQVLAASGVGSLRIGDGSPLSSADPLAGLSAATELVIDFRWPVPGGLVGDANDDVAVLPAVWNDEEIVVGPVLGGRRGRCRTCGGPRARSHGWAEAPQSAKAIGVGLVSAAALSYLSGLSPCEILTMSVRYDLHTRQSESALAGSDLGCPRCGVPELTEPQGPHPTAQVAWSYAESVEVPVGVDSGAERWLSVRSQSVFRRRHFNMPPLRRIAAEHGVKPPAALLSLLDLTLAAELAVNGGKVTGLRYRSLPTVEGVGTGSVYLLPQAEPSWIQGGAYYDPYEGELIPLSWPTCVGSSVAGFSLCITGDFTGAELCFGRFGRRVVFQDAGFLLAQLLFSGWQLRLGPVISSQWSPDSIHAALGLAAGEEALTVIDFAGESMPATDEGHQPDVASPQLADSWLGPMIERTYRASPPLLAGFTLYSWDGAGEIHEVRHENGKYTGLTRLTDGVVRHGAAPEAFRADPPVGSMILLIGGDLRARVYRDGAAAYASLVQQAAALAHYLSLVVGGLGMASRLMLKVPARLLAGSVRGPAGRHRVLAAVAVHRPDGSPAGPSSVEVLR